MRNTVNTKKQILLIDDEENLAQMLSMLLETRGYEVRVAYTAKEALKLVNSKYDLIILDLILPDSHGFEVCRRLKQKNETRNIPIIILSASTFCEDKVEGLYLGADDYLTKPCDHEELFARMEAVMRRSGNGRKVSNHTRQDEIVCELRKILDEALIVPHYQPIYTFHPFKLYGLEILSRPNTDSELSRPEVFFKAALEYGMYTDIEILSWSIGLDAIAKHVKGEKLFLNCNPYLIEASQFKKVKEVFEKNNISTENVILEITERSAISDFKLFYKHLGDYRKYGFRFAVDDVGGGYASLESIVEIKPEVVKIDRHIVNGCHDDSFKQSVIRFLVALCKENNVVSIAEGIETQEDLDMVKELGVDAGQGYYLFRPTPLIDFKKFNSVKL